MRYISTRQTGGWTVSFEHALLQGLARDGGLYIPERWPSLDTRCARGARRPALRRRRCRRHGGVHRARLLAHSTGDDRCGELRRLRPPRDGAAGAARPRPVAAGALPRPHARLQGLRAPDGGAPAGRGAGEARAHGDDPRRDLGRHGGCGDRGLPRPRGSLRGGAPPGGPGLRDAAPPDDVRRRAQRPQRRHRRHLRRLPGAGEGALRRSRAPRRDRACGGQLDQLGPGRGAAAYYVYAALALGAPARAVSFTVPTGNFGNVYAGYAARQMGVPIERLVVATNRNDILARFFESGLYRKGRSTGR